MPKHSTATDRLLDLAKRQPVLQVKDLREHGIHPEHLRRLLRKGLVERKSRGIYRLSETNATEHQALAEIGKRLPQSVVCLLSALAFHELGTQLSPDVWLAVERQAARPTSVNPPLRVVRMSGKAFSEGIGEHSIEGVKVQVYTPGKTVADCFKFRNKIGLDIAMEALRECWRGKKATMDELWRYAKICRVDKVMRPYLESLV